MSDVKRYDLLGEYSDTHIGEFLDGDYVRFADYETLRAELTEAQRRLKEASEQEPVGCMSPEQFSILTGDPVDNGVHVRVWHVYNPPSRAKSGVKLYAAPVPQPADDFRARLIALCQQWTPTNLDRCETPEEIIREVAEGQHSQPSVPEAVAKDAANKLSLAYGYLWHVDNMRPGYDAPAEYMRPQLTPEKAAYKARAVLREMLTNEQRGAGINRADAILSATETEVKKDV